MGDPGWKAPISVWVRQLAELKLILPQPRHWITRSVHNAAFRRGVVLNGVEQVDGVARIKEMVRDGSRHSVLPFAAVRDEVVRGTLSFLPIDHGPLLTVHAIASRRVTPAPFVTEVTSCPAWSEPAPGQGGKRDGGPGEICRFGCGTESGGCHKVIPRFNLRYLELSAPRRVDELIIYCTV